MDLMYIHHLKLVFSAPFLGVWAEIHQYALAINFAGSKEPRVCGCGINSKHQVSYFLTFEDLPMAAQRGERAE